MANLSPRMDYSLSDNDTANTDYSTQVIIGVLHAADGQDMLTIRRFALIGGARMSNSLVT